MKRKLLTGGRLGGTFWRNQYAVAPGGRIAPKKNPPETYSGKNFFGWGRKEKAPAKKKAGVVKKIRSTSPGVTPPRPEGTDSYKSVPRDRMPKILGDGGTQFKTKKSNNMNKKITTKTVGKGSSITNAPKKGSPRNFPPGFRRPPTALMATRGRPPGSMGRGKPGSGGSTIPDFSESHKNVLNMNEVKGINGSGWNATLVPENDHSIHDGNTTTLRSRSQGSIQHLQTADKIRVIKTVMHSGKPTSKGIKMLAKINGTVKRTLLDTKQYNVENAPNPIDREQLDHSHGFNTKRYWVMPGYAAPGTWDTLGIVYGEAVTTQLVNSFMNQDMMSVGVQSKYLSIMNFCTKMSFVNESNYLPLELKIHWVVPKIPLMKRINVTADSTGTPGGLSFVEQIVDKVFGVGLQQPDQNLIDVQPDFGMPVRYVLSAPIVQGPDSSSNPPAIDNYRRRGLSFELAVAANLNMSVGFREHFDIVHTFSETLDPNDIWRFHHVHHLGAGINVDTLRQRFKIMNGIGDTLTDLNTSNVQNDGPLDGFWIIESKGVPVSAIVGDANNATPPVVTPNTYQGTSNGTYHCEFKTEAQWVTNLSTGSVLDPGQFGAAEGCHVRVFKRKEFSTNNKTKVRHVLSSKMRNTTANLGANEAFVSVYTDKVQTVNSLDA